MKKLISYGLGVLSLVLILATVFSYVCPVQAHAAAEVLPMLAGLLDPAHAGSGAMLAGCIAVAPIVEEDCGANPGGTVELYVARRRDIDSIPEPVAGTVTVAGPIVMKPGKGFVKWDHAQDTGDLNHKSEGDPGNKSVSVDQSVYIPRGNPTIDAVINNAINGDFVTISVDSLGQMRLGGDLRRGLVFDYDYKSGKKGGDKNGSDFKFANQGFAHVPYYYTAAIPLAEPEGV